MSDVKYCEDCRWLRADDRCGHQSAAKTMRGEALVRRGVDVQFYASVQRNGKASESDCGTEARYFEPKEAAHVEP